VEVAGVYVLTSNFKVYVDEVRRAPQFIAITLLHHHSSHPAEFSSLQTGSLDMVAS
jgi:hypothetical protein